MPAVPFFLAPDAENSDASSARRLREVGEAAGGLELELPNRVELGDEHAPAQHALLEQRRLAGQLRSAVRVREVRAGDPRRAGGAADQPVVISAVAVHD